MSTEDLAELNRKIAVMEAYRDGKKIEYTAPPPDKKDDSHWVPISNPFWNWEMCDYRVKPEAPILLTLIKSSTGEYHGGSHCFKRTEAKIHFIELTPEIRKSLNL